MCNECDELDALLRLAGGTPCDTIEVNAALSSPASTIEDHGFTYVNLDEAGTGTCTISFNNVKLRAPGDYCVTATVGDTAVFATIRVVAK
jgi:hypothetical protein